MTVCLFITEIYLRNSFSLNDHKKLKPADFEIVYTSVVKQASVPVHRTCYWLSTCLCISTTFSFWILLYCLNLLNLNFAWIQVMVTFNVKGDSILFCQKAQQILYTSTCICTGRVLVLFNLHNIPCRSKLQDILWTEWEIFIANYLLWNH